MAIITGRASSAAVPSVDTGHCTSCGLCVAVCPTETLRMTDGKVTVDRDTAFGCIGCGQCMAVCPEQAVAVLGRELSPDDLAPHPDRDGLATDTALEGLLLSRRSIRHFKDREVELPTVDRVIELAATAPMGVPPSEVGLVVFHGRAKVQEYAADMVELMSGGLKFFRSPLFPLMGLTMGKAGRDLISSFVIPLLDTICTARNAGNDHLFYDAPLAIQFYAPQSADPADQDIAATYAMLAAESLGLGTCLIGSVGPVLVRSKAMKVKYGMPADAKPGLVLIAGYPRYKFSGTIKRTFAGVRYH